MNDAHDFFHMHHSCTVYLQIILSDSTGSEAQEETDPSRGAENSECSMHGHGLDSELPSLFFTNVNVAYG